MSKPTDPRSAPPDDVRMRGFSRRWTVEAALAWIDECAAPLVAEEVSLAEAAGRVLAGAIESGVDVPPFDRAMMDGYAVRAADTQGASPMQPLPLAVVGVALPGNAPPGPVGVGEAVRIMTGAPMPPGADAVLPAELTEPATDRTGSASDMERRADLKSALQCDLRGTGSASVTGGRVMAIGEVSPLKHVGRRGEDIAAGTTVLPAGRRLRPQDIGVLASIGCQRLRVVRRPRVRVIVTGNELYSAPDERRPFAIADANGPMLAALVARDGGIVERGAITPDDADALRNAIACDAPADADVVIVSGGSSVGEEDHAPRVVAELGELAIHGVAMRPSSPTGMGTIRGGDGRPRLVFLLPGNPVSCLCAYDFFAGRAIRILGGRGRDWPYRPTPVRLARKIASQIGRVDYARVRYVDPAPGRGEEVSKPPAVEPISTSGASILTSTTRADGFIVVAADSEGYPAGAVVTMYAYD